MLTISPISKLLLLVVAGFFRNNETKMKIKPKSRFGVKAIPPVLHTILVVDGRAGGMSCIVVVVFLIDKG